MTVSTTLHKGAAMDADAVIIITMLGRSHRKLDLHINEVKTAVFIHGHQIPNYVNKNIV